MQKFNPNFSHAIWKWRTIWRGLCVALMLVVVMPVWAEEMTSVKSSYIGNATDFVKDWWNDLWESSHKTKMGGSRNISKQLTEDALVVPFLEGRVCDAKLRVGKDKVYFWLKGGKPPYTIKVEKGGKVIGFKSNIKKAEVSLNLGAELEEGGYWVIVSDTAQNSSEPVLTKFQLVTESLPKPTDEERLEINNSQNPRVECVNWFATQENGEWAFEAYQLSMNGRTDEILSVCGITR